MSKNLKQFLIECKEAYYAGDPIISDEQYDHLEEICNEELDIGTNRGRVKHWYKMYSLQKYYEGETLPPWEGKRVVITPKLDGAAIALRYINRIFDSAITRGNGEYGEDVTHLFTNEVLTKLNIPLIIETKIPMQITGEIVAPVTIKNSRNYSAGALNLKDPEEFLEKDLTFIALDYQKSTLERYEDNLRALYNENFNTIHFSPTEKYPTDGKVYRINYNKEYNELGYTSKHPRGAFALKRRTEGVRTKILDVIWQIGKSGVVSPIAILEPVEIDGAIVSRATLNNFGFIEALGVQIGDSVFVERAGGIIPRIIRKAE